MVQLRSMSAHVEFYNNISVVVKDTQEVIDISNAFVLLSYTSVVAITDGKRIYLLPRYDYSNTTWKHLHAFVQDFTKLNDMCAKDIRNIIKHYDDNAQYVYCDAYRNTWGGWSRF